MQLKNRGLGPFFIGPVGATKKGVFARQVKFDFNPAGMVFSIQPNPEYWYSIVDIFVDRKKKSWLFFGDKIWTQWQRAEALEQTFDILKEKEEEFKDES
jgi:hypothetical protein